MACRGIELKYPTSEEYYVVLLTNWALQVRYIENIEGPVQITEIWHANRVCLSHLDNTNGCNMMSYEKHMSD